MRFEDVKTEDMKDGRYKISFLPTETGTSECAVTINGTPGWRGLLRQSVGTNRWVPSKIDGIL